MMNGVKKNKTISTETILLHFTVFVYAVFLFEVLAILLSMIKRYTWKISKYMRLRY